MGNIHNTRNLRSATKEEYQSVRMDGLKYKQNTTGSRPTFVIVRFYDNDCNTIAVSIFNQNSGKCKYLVHKTDSRVPVIDPLEKFGKELCQEMHHENRVNGEGASTLSIGTDYSENDVNLMINAWDLVLNEIEAGDMITILEGHEYYVKYTGWISVYLNSGTEIFKTDIKSTRKLTPIELESDDAYDWDVVDHPTPTQVDYQARWDRHITDLGTITMNFTDHAHADELEQIQARLKELVKEAVKTVK